MTKTRQLRTFTSVIKGSFNEFFQRSTSTGISILVVTAIALLWSNSPWQLSYSTLLHQPIEIVFAQLKLAFTFEHFVNDGLMVLFFLLVGLEIKREMLVGELSSRQKALLPMIAAVMGMVGPATIYLLFNAGTNSARGWGVPVATDIAFALGILALLGDRVPLGLKVFLAALAIVDDLLAVLVIAIFYTASLNMEMLLTAGIITSILFLGNKLRINTIWFYGLLGLALWVTVLFSGIHATIAGVVLALCIPADARIDRVSFFKSARELLEKISRQKKSAEDEG
ncbi:MAG TPA: Na+/H+ antiporter NhaA, partial [Candidatus Didemnitutus sp.]|nr:Na+/H+ antiporter NhaA [Candidatus Didemnitutus sp.]